MNSTSDVKWLVAEEASVFDRAFNAVEKVRERLNRACSALENAGVPYAVIGGHAVAAWVATIDDGAVRNTRDVDLLLDASDLDTAERALADVGFVRAKVFDVIMFLDGPDGKPSQGVHILIAGQKVQEQHLSPTPKVDQIVRVDDKRVVALERLVEMKLNSNRDKDRTHLRDMIGVGLIDETWPAKYGGELAERLQTLLDDPDG